VVEAEDENMSGRECQNESASEKDARRMAAQNVREGLTAVVMAPKGRMILLMAVTG
jgi:hypothetical protein